MGRVLKVDHTRYKRKDGEEEEERERMLQGGVVDKEESGEESEEEKRPMIKAEIELQRLMREHDEDDPMKDFLVQEKREEVQQALARMGDGKEGKKERKHRHHHRSHGRDHRENKKSDAGGDKDHRRAAGYGDRHRHGHGRRSRSP